MVFLGYAEGTKAYWLYDPRAFIVEHLVIHGGGDAGEEVPSTLGGVPSTPRGRAEHS